MTTMPCPATPLTVVRPWFSRLAAELLVRLRRRPAPVLSSADYAALSHLSEQTLRDIGAPDWVHESERGAPLWTLERMRW